jgi:hypothetical protein
MMGIDAHGFKKIPQRYQKPQYTIAQYLFTKKQTDMENLMRPVNQFFIPAVLLTLFLPGLCQACQQTLRSYGATGDGIVNDTLAIQNAFQSTCDLDGENLTYAVGGNLEIQNNITLANAKFIQTSSGVAIRTLIKNGGTVTLRHVTVNRGQNERNGSITDAAGIFLNNVSDSLLEDVEVTGNGYGSGIFVVDSNRVTLLRPHVHDMYWSTETPPRYEQMYGIFIIRSNYVNVLYARVINLLGETGDNVYRSWQSDGITLSATRYAFILGTAVENTGEGIDLTGSEFNEYFEIAHSAAIDNDSFGFKAANSARRGVIRDSVAIRSGYAGFIVNGPSEPNLSVLASDITIERCQALNTGANGRWAHERVSGFLVLQGLYNLDYPKKIRIVDSQASDNQSQPTMKVGFHSQTAENGV